MNFRLIRTNSILSRHFTFLTQVKSFPRTRFGLASKRTTTLVIDVRATTDSVRVGIHTPLIHVTTFSSYFLVLFVSFYLWSLPMAVTLSGSPLMGTGLSICEKLIASHCCVSKPSTSLRADATHTLVLVR